MNLNKRTIGLDNNLSKLIYIPYCVNLPRRYLSRESKLHHLLVIRITLCNNCNSYRPSDSIPGSIKNISPVYSKNFLARSPPIHMIRYCFAGLQLFMLAKLISIEGSLLSITINYLVIYKAGQKIFLRAESFCCGQRSQISVRVQLKGPRQCKIASYALYIYNAFV